MLCRSLQGPDGRADGPAGREADGAPGSVEVAEGHDLPPGLSFGKGSLWKSVATESILSL